MTISFSGLASGLDTSSWVESLVALKQAKINALEEEKENVLLSHETLASIKSFFNSFRSVIEKVTDAKFGIASMDLFAQNLAISANLDILTATATTEAEESVYDVFVNQLASNTSATSGYAGMKTVTATSNSLLTDLGIKAGNIGVNVNGVEHGMTLTEKDTIQSMIDKFSNIGVASSYNEKSGIFSIDISVGDINDIDNTGIVSALHLEGVNEGYTSNNFELVQTNTILAAATTNTKLSEFGVKNGTITVRADNADYNVTINSNTTLGSFISDLTANGIDASLDADGVFSIKNAYIVDEGTTDIIEKLGLNTDNPVYIQADNDTLLKNLGNGIEISDGQTVILKNSNNEETTITVGTTTTLGSLLSAMTNAGVYAALKSDGTVEITGGTITGGTFDVISALELTTEPYTAMTTGKPLTETVETFELVTLDTKLVDDLKVRAGYIEVTDADGNKFYEKIYHGQTLSDFMSDMGNLGIYTKLRDDGVLEITGGAFATLSDDRVQELIADGTIRETDDRYKQGTDLLTCLYGAPVISTDQISVASTYSKSRALTHSVINTINASLTTTLGNLSLKSEGTAVFDVMGDNRTINVTKSMTIEGLMNALNGVGIASSWDSDTHRLTIENAVLNGGTSDLSDVLDLTTTVSGKYVTSNNLYQRVTVTVGKTTASSTLLSSTTYVTADLSTTLGQLGINKNNVVTVYEEDGTTTNLTFASTATIDSIFDTLDAYGVQGVISDGVITLTSADGAYVKDAAGSDLLASLGIGIHLETITTTTTTGTTQTSGAFSYNEYQTAKITDKISTFTNANGVITINNNGASVGTVTIDSDTTFEDLFKALDNYGVQASMEDGIVTITSNQGHYLTGTPLTALGITTSTSTQTITTTTTAGTTQTSGAFSYDEYQTAKITDKISTFTNANGVITINNNGASVGTVTIDSDTTFEDLFKALDNYGVQASMEDGIVTITSNQGHYLTGSPLDALGIMTSTSTQTITTTTTAGTTQTSGAFSYDEYQTAKITDKISTFANANGVVTVNNSSGAAVGTVTIDSNTTFEDLFKALDNYGVQASMEDGIVTITSNQGHYLTGTPLDALGITTTIATHTVTTTTTVGTSQTSSALTYVEDCCAKIGDKISTFATVSGDVVITNYLGQEEGRISVDNDTTFEDLFRMLDDYGIQGTMEDGVISLTSSVGNYVTGSLVTDLGIGLDSTVITKTVGTSTTGGMVTFTTSTTTTTLATVTQTLYTTDTIVITEPVIGTQTMTVETESTVVVTVSGAYTSTTNVVATRDTKLGDLNLGISDYGIDVTVYGLDGKSKGGNGTSTFTAEHTLGQLLDWFDNQSFPLSVSLNDGVIQVTEEPDSYIAGAIISGSLAEALGLSGNVVFDYYTRDSRISSESPITYTTTTVTTTTTETTKTQNVGTTTIPIADVELGAARITYSTGSIIVGCMGDIYVTISINASMTFGEVAASINIAAHTAGAESVNVYCSGTEFFMQDCSTIYNGNMGNTGTFNHALNFENRGTNLLVGSYTSTKDIYATVTVTTTTTATSTIEKTVNSEMPMNWGAWASQKGLSNSDLTITVYNCTTGAKVTTVTIPENRGPGEFTTSGFQTIVSASSDLIIVGMYEDVSNSGQVDITTKDGYYYEMSSALAAAFNMTTTTNRGDPRYKVEHTNSVKLMAEQEDNNSTENLVTVVTKGTATITIESTSTQPHTVTVIGTGTYETTTFELSTTTSTATMTGDTKLSQLGLASYGCFTVVSDGVTHVVAIQSEETVNDMLTALAGYGISGQVQNGALTLAGTENAYITGLDSYMETIFGINSGYYTTKDVTTYSNTISNKQHHNVTLNVSDTTKMSQTGHEGTITVNYNGVDYYVTATGDKTVGAVLAELAGFGVSGSIADGVIKLTGTNDGFIKDAGGAFGITGSAYTTSTQTVVTTTGFNSLSDEQGHTLNFNATSDTKMSVIGQVGTITVNYNGVDYYVTATGDKTVGDVLAELAGYGVSGSIKDGVIKLTGTNDGFIKDAGGAFGITGSAYTTSTQTVVTTTGFNSLSDEQGHTLNFNATSDTKMSVIGQVGTITVNYNGVDYYVTATGDKTVGDVLAELAGYGVSGSIKDGVIKLTGTNDGFIKDAGGAFGITGSAYTTSTQTVVTTTGFNSLSDEQGHTLNFNATSDTKMSVIGQVGTITVNYKGVDYYVTATGDKTVGDVLAELAGYGVSGSIKDGVIKLTGTNDGFIKDAGGAFGINGSAYTTTVTTTETGYNSNSDEQGYDTTKTITTESSLSSMGLTANGTITVQQNGVLHTVTVKTSDTIDDMFTQLAALDIHASLNNGTMILQGTESSYIKDISTNLNNVLKLSVGEGNSYVTSTYTSESTLGTKLNELTDSSGTSLGITSGNIYVYKDGTRYLVNINANDTLETLGAKLSQYGITMELDSNGKLYFQGDNNSYLTTQGISAGASNILTKLNISNNWSTRYDSTSDNLKYTTHSNNTMNGNTLLSDLQDSSGNNLGITTGSFYVYNSGVRTTETITADMTVNDLMSVLAKNGLIADIAEDGSISVGAYNNSYLATSATAGDNSNIVSTLFSEWNFVNIYTSNDLAIPTDVVKSVNRDTKLADINEGTYQAGYITVVKDGIQTNIELTADDTIGSLVDQLSLYGFESVINENGQLILKNTGNSLLQNYSGSAQASNALSILGIELGDWIQTNTYKGKEVSMTAYNYEGLEQVDEFITSTIAATESTVINQLNNEWGENIHGDLSVTVNGVNNIIKIQSDETIGSMLDKFRSLGLEASISSTGQIMIQSGLNTFTINTANSSSSLANSAAKSGLTYHDDLGGYAASNNNVEANVVDILSAANYATMNTKLGTLNITDGKLSIYKNGEKATVDISSSDTFNNLRSKIATAFGYSDPSLSDIDLTIEDGYLRIYSKKGDKIVVGSTTDGLGDKATNIVSICGFTSNENGDVVSARELYCVNSESLVTQSGLFRRGNVTEGTFIIGDAEFTITNTTKLSELIAQINSSDKANASAYWDSIEGELVITSRTTGSALINIESGTSNFTDILGYTTSKTESGKKVSKMNMDSQEIGNNAKFSINGTYYTSSSNNITSDISRIKGLTINLKGLTEGSSVKLTVERDKETLSNAIAEVVETYNELIENVDKEIAKDGKLNNQSTLKLIRNQLRNLMTSSDAGATVFKNLDAIGISVDRAQANNISTNNITNLTFDKDKFLKAFDADQDALKALLIGSDTNEGVFTKVENMLESALKSVTGYFATAENSYNKQVSKIDSKIEKQKKALDRYRAQLEAKFSSMDILIANMQQQYSSFLRT